MYFLANIPDRECGANKLDKCASQVHTDLRKRFSTGLSLLAALGLSACGGGSATTTSSLDDTSGGDGAGASDQDAGGVDTSNGGGGLTGGTGGGSVASNSLILSRSGADYVTSSVAGFTLLGGDSHYQVADAADDSYDVKLTASGDGMLTFEFIDADDVITLSGGSSVSGFAQLKVVRGTVDVSDANLNGVTYVSVASSIKLTAAQVLDLNAILINAASGSVQVEVTSEAEIIQISDAMTNGSLSLFSPSDNLFTVTVAPGAVVSEDEIAQGQVTFNTQTKDIADVTDSAVIIIRDGNGGLTYTERAVETLVNVFPEDGATFVSARVDGVDVGSVSTRSFYFDASAIDSGFHTLAVTTESASGVRTVTQQEFLVVGQTSSPSEIFELKTSEVSGVITVDAYVKNVMQSFEGGIKSYNFYLDLDETKFDYVEGSFSTAEGSVNDGSENELLGEIFANGFFTTGPWTSFDDPLFSFEVIDRGVSSALELAFIDMEIYQSALGNFNIETII